MEPPTLDWVLPHQSKVKTIPHRHTHKTNLTQVVPRMRLSSEVTLRCDKLTFETNQHHTTVYQGSYLGFLLL